MSIFSKYSKNFKKFGLSFLVEYYESNDFSYKDEIIFLFLINKDI